MNRNEVDMLKNEINVNINVFTKKIVYAYYFDFPELY